MLKCLNQFFWVALILFVVYLGFVYYQRQSRKTRAITAGVDPAKAQRSIIEFDWPGSIWPLVESWAVDEKFKINTDGAAVRLYNRYRDPTVREMVKISQIDGRVRIEAWLKDMVGEHSIESGGMYAVNPRRNARQGTNALLRLFGQPEIQ